MATKTLLQIGQVKVGLRVNMPFDGMDQFALIVDVTPLARGFVVRFDVDETEEYEYELGIDGLWYDVNDGSEGFQFFLE